VAPRDARIRSVSCRHQRFCAACAEEVHSQGRRCSLSRSIIDVATGRIELLLQCFYVGVSVVLSLCIKYVTYWSRVRESILISAIIN